MKYKTEYVVLLADLLGIALLAAQGAVAAMNHDLDLFGVLAVAFLAALGGGVIRDVLLGATPPSAIEDWRYPALTILIGFAAFVFHSTTDNFEGWLAITVDAAGLAICAVAGAEKALDFHIRPFTAILMGGVTAVGGGIIRDVVLRQIPVVFVTEIYATAALLGAGVLVLLRHYGVKPVIAALIGGGLCFVIRMFAVWQHWQLPTFFSA